MNHPTTHPNPTQTPRGFDDVVDRVAELSDLLRRTLYDYVTAADHPIRRDEAAIHANITRSLAAYHLDRLADAGLLAVTYKRPEGRDGPGAGRPAKHYQRAPGEMALTIPPRNYPLLARLLADVVATNPQLEQSLMRAAQDEGRNIGSQGGDLEDTLRADGYEPRMGAAGEIELHNCPFHALAKRQTELVCGMNLELLRGVLAGRGEDPARVELRPAPDQCCVIIHPRKETL